MTGTLTNTSAGTGTPSTSGTSTTSGATGSGTSSTTGASATVGTNATNTTGMAGGTSSATASVSTGGGTTGTTTAASVSAGGTGSGDDTVSTTGSGSGGYDSDCTREETEAAKAVVREGITEVFINGNGAVIDDYWADPYIQHNPIATSGVDTFKSFFSGVSPGFYSLTRLIGECDKVLIHGSYQGSGATFDMLRVDPDIDRMVEHWDAAVTGNEGANPFLGGPTEVGDVELTGSNRDLVIGFVNDVMIGGNTDSAGDYLSDSLIEHASGGMNGAAAFVQRINDGGISYSTIHHQIADGNFVFTLSEGQAGGTAYGFWDLFRVEASRIAEHWGTRLEVQTGASGAGIF